MGFYALVLKLNYKIIDISFIVSFITNISLWFMVYKLVLQIGLYVLAFGSLLVFFLLQELLFLFLLQDLFYGWFLFHYLVSHHQYLLVLQM